MRVWIVGKRGMLSQAFQRILQKKKIDFFVTGKEETDITQLEDLQAFFTCCAFTHVINCSGFTDVDLAESSYDEAYALNVRGVAHLAKLSSLYHKRLIHFSTDYVFDGKKKTPYLEEDKCNPLSVYGKTKRLGEKELFVFHPEACLIRTAWLFGREGDNFVKKMVALMKKSEKIEVVEDQIGCPTFCDDLAETALLLLEQKGIFHFVNREETSWYRFAKEILEQLKGKGVSLKCRELLPISSKEYKTVAFRPAYSVLSTEKYESLGYPGPRPWQNSLQEVIGMYAS